MTARMRVVLQFISNAPLPPHHGSDHGRNQRHEHQDNPAQPTQRLFAETEGERLRDFWCDTDKLFPTKQPVHTARDEIESLLVLGDGIVLNKSRVTNYYQTRGIHLHSLISAATFFDCCANC